MKITYTALLFLVLQEPFTLLRKHKQLYLVQNSSYLKCCRNTHSACTKLLDSAYSSSGCIYLQFYSLVQEFLGDESDKIIKVNKCGSTANLSEFSTVSRFMDRFTRLKRKQLEPSLLQMFTSKMVLDV
ncbi:hypothetical protein L6452_19040 [Arctium lappa]|uniref:Uncharacterized protein n=1 Tax=Arctium lappa TaxID=4217 RepID=A0ACB9B7V8_ARCLA|nr:hypothetical protein L6452_19040 [Arctium lappa]